jgi:hypothetical protein
MEFELLLADLDKPAITRSPPEWFRVLIPAHDSPRMEGLIRARTAG